MEILFFYWTSIEFTILDEETHNNFFSNQHPDYKYADFRIYDKKGNNYEKDYIEIFPYDDDDRYEEINLALNYPLSKYYYLQFNEYDTNTLEVIIKGTLTDPCGYETLEYIKVYYNGKVVYYRLF